MQIKIGSELVRSLIALLEPKHRQIPHIDISFERTMLFVAAVYCFFGKKWLSNSIKCIKEQILILVINISNMKYHNKILASISISMLFFMVLSSSNIKTIPVVTAQISDCTNIQNKFVEARQTNQGSAFMPVVITTNQPGNGAGVASYAFGNLIYHTNPNQPLGDTFSTQTGQPLKQYFSDRTYTQTGSIDRQPFNPAKTDNIGVSIIRNSNSLFHVTFTLLSWGNAQFGFDAHCAQGILYGFGPPAGNQGPNQMIVISLEKVIPIPG
jgi:hypothetical protein